MARLGSDMGREWLFVPESKCSEECNRCDNEDCEIARPDLGSFAMLRNAGYKKKEIFFCKAYNIYCAIKEQDKCEPEKCNWYSKCKMLSKLNEQER